MCVWTPETMFFSKKGKTVFSPQNLCMKFKISKMCQNYTFWKLDISTIISLFVVYLIREPQEGVLSPRSIRGYRTHNPLDLNQNPRVFPLFFFFISFQTSENPRRNQLSFPHFSPLACWGFFDLNGIFKYNKPFPISQVCF